MHHATVDSKSTTAVLHENLHKIDQQTGKLNSDIPEFNCYVTNNYEQLIDHG